MKLGDPERVRIFFQNGSVMEVLGDTITMPLVCKGQRGEYFALSNPFTQLSTPSLNINISGDMKIMLYDAQNQPVKINTLDGLV